MPENALEQLVNFDIEAKVRAEIASQVLSKCSVLQKSGFTPGNINNAQPVRINTRVVKMPNGNFEFSGKVTSISGGAFKFIAEVKIDKSYKPNVIKIQFERYDNSVD